MPQRKGAVRSLSTKLPLAPTSWKDMFLAEAHDLKGIQAR